MPFENGDEVVTVINKSVIASLTPVDQVMAHAQPAPVKIGLTLCRHLARE